jgi:L-ribulose-5-phosphate 4-epimerase
MRKTELRQRVVEANLQLVREGLVTLTWGNASGIAADRSCVAIKPSGVKYDALTAAEIVLVDLEGNLLDGDLEPSSDTPTHLQLYRSFPEIGGIAHTHSARAVAFAQARREIPCLGTTHADHFHGAVPVTRVLRADEVAEAYEHYTGRAIVERFDRLDPLAIPAVLVAGHGPFTWGPDVGAAVRNAVALEAVAAMAIDTLALEPQARTLEGWIHDKHHARKHGPDAYYGQPDED